MKKVVLTYGIISGIILGGVLAMFIPLLKDGNDYMEKGMIYGFSSMILGFSMIYFAIASFKKNNGTVSIKQGLIIGSLITLIGCFMYACAWMVIYSNFAPDFGDKYADVMVKSINASTKLSAAEKAQQVEEITSNMTLYKNNAFYRFGMTFMEPLFVGVIISIIASLILFTRKKQTSSVA